MMSNSTATERALMFSSEVRCTSCHTSLARGDVEKKSLNFKTSNFRDDAQSSRTVT